MWANPRSRTFAREVRTSGKPAFGGVFERIFAHAPNTHLKNVEKYAIMIVEFCQ